MNNYHRFICPRCGNVLYARKGQYACSVCHIPMKQKDQKSHRKTPFILWAVFVLVLIAGLALHAYNESGGALNLSLPKFLQRSDPAGTAKPSLSAPGNSLSVPPLVRTADLHQTLMDGLRERQISISIRGFDVTSIKNEMKAIIRDHPEFFWLPGGFNCLTHTTDLGTWTEVMPNYYDFENIPVKETKLNNLLYGISTKIPEGASNYEKALIVHDFIVNTTEYDYESMGKEEFTEASSAYGCLIEHKAVCGGYAKAYKLILDYLGIPCGYVTGDITDRGSHAWNYITLEGKAYFVDVTWDDAVFSDGETNGLCSHEYFCVTTQELSRSHLLDPGQDVPPCDSTDYDYFRVNQLYLDPYTIQQAVYIITSSPAEEWMEIKFASPEQQAAACQELFYSGILNNYLLQLSWNGYRIMHSSKNTSQVLKYRIYRAT